MLQKKIHSKLQQCNNFSCNAKSFYKSLIIVILIDILFKIWNGFRNSWVMVMMTTFYLIALVSISYLSQSIISKCRQLLPWLPIIWQSYHDIIVGNELGWKIEKIYNHCWLPSLQNDPSCHVKTFVDEVTSIFSWAGCW